MSIFLKTEDQCLEDATQAAKEALENYMHHHDTMKTISRAYLSNQDCSVQEAVYNILSELNLRRLFQTVHFISKNLSEERVQILLYKKEFSKLTDNSPNIFQKSNIACYMERPSTTFFYEKKQCFIQFVL